MVGTVAAARTPKPVLQCVKLGTSADGLVLMASDLQVGLRCLVRQVETKAEGEALVAADKLSAIVRESSDDTLSLEMKDANLEVRGGDSRFLIYGRDPKEFPPVSELSGKADLEIKAGVLGAMIERTLYAVARENTRYAINGILWEKKGKKLQLVATDGRRLAQAIGAAEVSIGEDRQVILPAKAMAFLGRNLDDPSTQARIKFEPSQCVIEYGDWTVSSVLVEGHFPKYEDVIPQDSDKVLEVDRETFLSAIRRAALLTTPESKGVRFAFADDMLTLSSRVAEQGEATIRFPVEYAYPPMEIGFNPQFLMDMLRVLDDEKLKVELKETNRPAVLRSGSDFLYVVMPVNLS
jgi:DNA polymerase-3 subunit beta